MSAMIRLLDRVMRLPARLRDAVRGAAVRSRFGRCGRNLVFFPERSAFHDAGRIRLGNDVFIGEEAHFSGSITVGDRVLFGPRVTILAGNHLFAVRGQSVRFLRPRGDENAEPVAIEDEAWCGAGAVILGGAVLGAGCVIGAGSVVTKPIPPYVVAVGNPCRPIRRIFEDRGLAAHLSGLNAAGAGALIRRRKRELAGWKLSRIPAIERVRSGDG